MLVIAVINIVIVCFVYNNTTTHNSNIVLEQVGEDKDHEDNPVDTNNKHSDENVKKLHKQVSEIQKTFNHKDKSDIAIQDAKKRDKIIDIKTAVKSSKEERQNSTKHDAVMSMKNLLSVHIAEVKVTKNTTLPPPHSLGKELQERLLDSSEIDLSPPNPIIIPPSPPITDQVTNYPIDTID